MEFHANQLSRACRVCGKNLNKAKKRERSFLVSEHSKELAAVFGIDTTRDTEDIHPPSFCLPCRVFITSWHSRVGNAPAVGRVYTWQKHSETDCTVSKAVLTFSQNSRHIKLAGLPSLHNPSNWRTHI